MIRIETTNENTGSYRLNVSQDTILVTDKTIARQKTDDDIRGYYFVRIQGKAAKTTEAKKEGSCSNMSMHKMVCTRK